jgi:uncharacterized protein YhhL (DUF1145 family)
MMAIGKLVVGIVWLAAAWAFLLPEGHAWAATGRTLFVVMLAVHAVEALAFLPRLRAAGGSLAGHLAQTLLFGFLHVGSLPREAARQ